MNINDQFAVNLTDEGERMLVRATDLRCINGRVWTDREYMDTCHPLRPDGRRVFHLWELMRYFGPAMFNGNPALPIETEIEPL